MRTCHQSIMPACSHTTMFLKCGLQDDAQAVWYIRQYIIFISYVATTVYTPVDGIRTGEP